MNEKTDTGPAPANTRMSGTLSMPGKSGPLVDLAEKAGTQAAAAAGAVVDDAKQRGASLAGEVKDRVTSVAEDGKAGVADKLDQAAEALHRSGEQFEGHQDWIAKLVERGADEMGSLAATLRTNDLQGLLGKVGDLARRQPAVFVGVAMAAGFAAVRLGKVAVAGASQADLPKLPEVDRERK